MVPGIAGRSLHIDAHQELRLQPGDSVVVSVIKPLGEGKWAIGIKGRVIPAVSALPLERGALIRARVERSGDSLLLRIETNRSDPLSPLIARLGLDEDPWTRRAVLALLRSGLRIDGASVRKIQRLCQRTGRSTHAAARLAAILLDKGFDLDSPRVEPLFQLLNYGDGQERGQGYRRGKRFPRDASDVRNAVQPSPAEDKEPPTHPIQVFNQLPGKHESWIIVPFDFEEGSDRYRGSLRLLLDLGNATVRKLVLAVSTEPGDRWYFLLPLAGAGQRTLSVFASRTAASRAVKRRIGELASKLHNLGIELDDTIHEISECDGFSPPWEDIPYKAIDVAG